jgi:hypothetical protein
MKDWAQFQPKLAQPRVDPGQLFDPAEYSHMFEIYWDYLQDPTQHPDVDSSAQYYAPMSAYTLAVSSMDFSSFTPSLMLKPRRSPSVSQVLQPSHGGVQYKMRRTIGHHQRIRLRKRALQRHVVSRLHRTFTMLIPVREIPPKLSD